MLILVFLTVATVLNVALGFLVQFKAYGLSLRLGLLALSAFFTTYLWLGYFAVFSGNFLIWANLQRWLLALDLVITLGILDLTRRFLRSGHQELDFSIGARRIPFSALAGVGALAGVASLFIPGTLAVVGDAGEAILRFGGVSLIAPSVQILISIYVL
jgi:hypothetical protein